MELLVPTPEGLYCPQGDFHVDPWRGVKRAVITHAHADHARWGSQAYLCSTEGEAVLRTRLGSGARIQSVGYGQVLQLGEVRLSLHPAGHILGSAQVRIEYRGQVWVVSGDYKTEPDRTATAFQPVRCHTFITECTFGLPVYRWQPQLEVMEQVNRWWQQNQTEGRTSVLFAYSLGKAQRLLAGVDASIGPLVVHGAVASLNAAYQQSGVDLPTAHHLVNDLNTLDLSQALVVAPPNAENTPWMRRFKQPSTAFASGWMQVRGMRRRRNLDRGFVLSDHADWPGLLQAIADTGAERVLATHGYIDPLVRYLQEVKGIDAAPLPTLFGAEEDGADPEATPTEDPAPTPA